MFLCENIHIELYDQTCVTAITIKYNATHKQTQKPKRIFTTEHNYDSVYFAIIFNIDIYKSKQSKTSIPSINEWNSEIFNVIGAVVIDIHQRTKTEKTLSLSNIVTKVALEKNCQTTFFSVCVRWCISITTASMTLNVSRFHSLILGIDALDWLIHKYQY